MTYDHAIAIERWPVAKRWERLGWLNETLGNDWIVVWDDCHETVKLTDRAWLLYNMKWTT